MLQCVIVKRFWLAQIFATGGQRQAGKALAAMEAEMKMCFVMKARKIISWVCFNDSANPFATQEGEV